MPTTAKLIRGRITAGEPYIWRLLVDLVPAECPASVTIATVPNTDVAQRSVFVEMTGDVTTGTLTAGRTYSGDVSTTAEFGSEGGSLQLTFTDLPKRSLNNVSLEVQVNVGGTVYTVNPTIGRDYFSRRDALSGDLVYQLLMQADSDDEEYLQDIMNSGWNLAKMFRMLEQLDTRVYTAETTPVESTRPEYVVVDGTWYGFHAEEDTVWSFIFVPTFPVSRDVGMLLYVWPTTPVLAAATNFKLVDATTWEAEEVAFDYLTDEVAGLYWALPKISTPVEGELYPLKVVVQPRLNASGVWAEGKWLINANPPFGEGDDENWVQNVGFDPAVCGSLTAVTSVAASYDDQVYDLVPIGAAGGYTRLMLHAGLSKGVVSTYPTWMEVFHAWAEFSDVGVADEPTAHLFLGGYVYNSEPD